MNRLLKVVALVGAFFAGITTADACTNFIVTRGASTDGSNMVTTQPTLTVSMVHYISTFQESLKSGWMLPSGTLVATSVRSSRLL